MPDASLNTPLQLSVLDQSVSCLGRGEDQAIRDTLALAQHCEALGYRRFWVSEHHALPTIVGTAPEVLLAAIAARTKRIRLGSAGVMLPHYAPYKVAEQFRVLDALASGRIDLGVGRAPGGDMRTASLLNPNWHASDRFAEQVQELQAWVTGAELPPNHPGHGVAALPRAASAPQIWMLGSSNYGAQLAAALGLPYAFAYFITDGQGAQPALDLYRQQFVPGVIASPQATACVWALAADTEEQAWHLFESRARARADRLRGHFGPLLPPQQAARAYSSAEQAYLAELRAQSLVGTAPVVAQGLRALAAQLQVNELVVLTWTWDAQAQARSYELLAREFNLC